MNQWDKCDERCLLKRCRQPMMNDGARPAIQTRAESGLAR